MKTTFAKTNLLDLRPSRRGADACACAMPIHGKRGEGYALPVH